MLEICWSRSQAPLPPQQSQLAPAPAPLRVSAPGLEPFVCAINGKERKLAIRNQDFFFFGGLSEIDHYILMAYECRSLHISNGHNYYDTKVIKLVLLRLGLSEVAQNHHN